MLSFHRNLPTTDVDSLSDPYVSIFTGTKSPTDYFYSWTYFGSTSSKIDTQNPVWDEVFEYEPINGTYQVWTTQTIPMEGFKNNVNMCLSTYRHGDLLWETKIPPGTQLWLLMNLWEWLTSMLTTTWSQWETMKWPGSTLPSLFDHTKPCCVFQWLEQSGFTQLNLM